MALKVGSLVSNIVQKAGTFDQKVIDESIERLAKKSEHLKGELYELVKGSHVEFDSYVSISVSLEQRAQSVKSEYQKISTRIEQDLNSKIAETFHKKDEVEAKLKNTKTRILLIQQMIDIHQGIESSRADIQAGKYKAAAGKLSSSSGALSVLADGGCNALVFRALKSEQAIVVADLIVQLEQEWQKYMVWSPKIIPSDPSIDFLSSVKLELPVLSAVNIENMKEVIDAMNYLSGQGVWKKRATLFANKLLKLFIKPLITHESLNITRVSNKKQMVLGLQRSESNLSTVQLFDALLIIFQIVGCVVVAQYRGEWLHMVGSIICPEIEELVVARRLSTTIPRSLSELEEYEQIQRKTEEFESSVVSLGLVEEGKMNKMSQYANDINAHFVMQKSQDMLLKARSTLLQPIDDTITVPNMDQNPILKLKEILSNSSKQEVVSKGNYGKEFSDLTFKFPQCSISKSVQEYVSLLYFTLKDCVESTSTATGLQNFHMARSMIDLFCAVLPTYHGSAISGSPHVAAIQYNNCMYLAHHLVTLGHQFYSHLPPPLNEQSSTFVDYVPIVRQLGDDCLSSEMKRQSTYVIGCLKSIGSFSKISDDDHRETVWQSTQKAVARIGKVSKSYHRVLPGHMHQHIVGKLLDVFYSDVIQMVLSMEDISAADGTELHALLKMVVAKASQVLLLGTGTEELAKVMVASKNWEKIRSLSVILDASLLEITEMWDCGKGSLAKHFTVGEARGLIKAIFKNTERRATALSKITVIEA